MKIVIDIPDRICYGVKNSITVNGSDASQMLIDAVKNGTPLDDIKAEINERLWNDDAERVFEIIDKHMKEGE